MRKQENKEKSTTIQNDQSSSLSDARFYFFSWSTSAGCRPILSTEFQLAGGLLRSRNQI
jgi:hypothetical protein